MASIACDASSNTPGVVVDGLGRSVKLTAVPQRIVSLAPANTEMLFAIGLGEEVVGVTEFANYPEEASTREKVGGYSDVDLEKLISLQPDLVVADGIQHESEIIPALERLDVPVIALNPITLEEVLADMELLGLVTGNEKQASNLVASLEDRISSVTDVLHGVDFSEKPDVLFVVWHDPIWTSGMGTLANDLMGKAGGRNIASEVIGYGTISLESVVSRAPDVIVVVGGHGEGEDLPFQWVMSDSRLKDVPAMAGSSPNVYQVDADITTRPGPRIVDGLELLAELIHPELF
jgi:iron complex transport system substrate-binding protein